MKPVKVYLAGKISHNDWRHNIVPNLGGTYGDSQAFSHNERWPEIPISPRLVYVGPYFISCDHGCFHGEADHGAAANRFLDNDDCRCPTQSSFFDQLGWKSHEMGAPYRNMVRELCLEAIDVCDVVFAYLQPSAIGTLVELGYARAKGKKIVIVSSSEIDQDYWFASGLADALYPHADHPIPAFNDYFERELANDLSGICESPIEKKLFEAFTLSGVRWKRDQWGVKGFLGDVCIQPQYTIDQYRVDFLVEKGGKGWVIELDGHDFHEKTKDQASRDKRRDRFLIGKGYTVLRYTGSEVWANPDACAKEIFSLVGY
jgi:very-short-patch-repair endonuclease